MYLVQSEYPMLFPFVDLRFAGYPVAEIIMPNGQMRLFKIKLVHGNYFFVKYNKDTGGIFRLDRSKRIPFYKTAIYHYDARSSNPLDLKVLKEIMYFANKNKLHKITRRDVLNGAKLRKIFSKGKKKKEAIDELKQDGIEEQNTLGARTQELMTPTTDEETGETIPGLKFMVDNDADYILDKFPLFSQLVADKLLDEEQALIYAEKIEKGDMDFEELSEEFNKLKIFDLDTQISTDAQLFLDDYHSFNPSEPYQYIKMSKTSKKGFDDMASGTVKPAIPIMGIVMAMLVMIVGIPVILNNVDQSTLDGFMNSMPSPPPMLGGGWIFGLFGLT